jgi:sulfur carrier protein
MTAPATAQQLSISVNDEPRLVPAESTLHDLLAALDLSGRKGVAVALNGTVVARSALSGQALSAGDRVLVIRATQGG